MLANIFNLYVRKNAWLMCSWTQSGEEGLTHVYGLLTGSLALHKAAYAYILIDG